MTGVGALRALEPPVRVFVAATGAGAGVQGALWAVPGSSSFLAGALFPYATHEVDRFLGFAPERYCDEETALELAVAAYLRARESAFAEAEAGTAAAAGAAGAEAVAAGAVGRPGARALGLGLTASVASLVPHRGDHRVLVASVGDRDGAGEGQAGSGAVIWSARLPKGVGEGPRARDGHFADRLGVHALLAAAGVVAPRAPDGDLDGDLLSGIGVERREIPESVLRASLLRRPLFDVGDARAAARPDELRAMVLLPGSFDPFHRGHRMVADAVERAAGRRVVYTLTADPVHKSALRAIDLLDRVASIRQGRPGPRAILLTERDPLFIDKARQFPGAALALGVDAVARMLDPVWGPGVVELLEGFRRLGTRFYVVGRLQHGQWTELGDLAIPAAFRDLFQAVDGRDDISSTELRAGA